jgi:hypothetical protein
MATERVVVAAVERAVATATVDRSAPYEERCRVAPEALAAVIGLCDSGKNRDLVLDVVDRALQRAVEGLDEARTLAAVVLRARIEAATEHRLIVVENLQGDVGTGGGPQV